MPRFFFHLCNGEEVTEDRDGSEDESLEAAHQRADAILRANMSRDLIRGELNMGAFIEVEDAEHGHAMFVAFSEAVTVTKKVGQRPR